MPAEDLSQFSLAELFRMEAETQLAALSDGIIRLETPSSTVLDDLMRAAHSLKGAARVVGIEAGVRIAHGMEDVFVRAKADPACISPLLVDAMLSGVDLLRRVAKLEKEAGNSMVRPEEVEAFVGRCTGCLETPAGSGPAALSGKRVKATEPPTAIEETPGEPAEGTAPRTAAPFLRVASANLNHLVELAGESRILLRQLRTFVEEARMLVQAQRRMEALPGHRPAQAPADDGRRGTALEMQSQWQAWRTQSLQHASRLQDYDLRAGLLADRLYAEALACRMRPFEDCLPALRRLVHDTGRQLGKSVRLAVSGESTQVDREILERLEGVFMHLLRNAVDHGIEPGDDRLAAAKAPEGTIRLAVRQFGGRLVVRVEDDGRGIDLDQVRQRAIAANYTSAEAAGQLSPEETLEFLFLPGFSLRDHVTEVSGRGVGLDAVQSAIRALRGSVRLSSTPGQGTRFEISVPISLSIARCLLVEIAGEPWAIPLSRLTQLVEVAAESIESIQGQPFIQAGHERIGLVQATQLLGLKVVPVKTGKLSVMVISKGGHLYGIIVDRFLQQVELSVQEMPAELGKIRHFSAVSVLADGSPVLLLDDEDLVSSIQSLVAAGQLCTGTPSASARGATSKRILVVEDSLTVRELERKVLAGCGYAVETATDGMDGWNKLRTSDFDLVITDVDMPRMDGIELVKQIRATPRFHDLPVIIVTYKGRPEDRQRGLEAGADYYFTKSSFHNDELVRVVEEVIGGATG